MTTKDDLYQAILDDPNNDQLRLIYADWCEEHGDAERAEFIRTQLQLDPLFEFDDGYEELATRAKELLREHQTTWSLEFAKREKQRGITFGSHSSKYFRGFLGWVERNEDYIKLPWWVRHFDDVSQIFPIDTVAIDYGSGTIDVDGLLENPRVSQLRGIFAEGAGFTSITRRLANTTHLTEIRKLNLELNEFGDEGVEQLVGATQFSRLRELQLGYNMITDIGLQTVAKTERFPELRVLDLSTNEFGAGGVASLAKSDSFPRLGRLNLSRNQIGEEGVTALVATEHYHELRHLDLNEMEISIGALMSLAEAQHFPQLRILNLAKNGINDEGLAALAKSKNFLNLRELNLANNNITDKGLEAFAKFGFFPQLRVLKLSENNVTENGLDICQDAAVHPEFEVICYFD